MFVAIQGDGIGPLDPRQQRLIAGGEQGRAAPGGIHVEVDLLALGNVRQLRQGVDGAEIGAAGHADQCQHLELLFLALGKSLLQRRHVEPVLVVGREAPGALRAPSPSRSIPWSKE